jgi:hypothetical protein
VTLHVDREGRAILVTTSDRTRLFAHQLTGATPGEDPSVPRRIVRHGTEAIVPARANVDVDLYEGPSARGPARDALPRGTDVWVIEGPIGRHASRTSEGWAFVTSAPAIGGWVSSRHLTVSPRCHDMLLPNPSFDRGDLRGPHGVISVDARTGLEVAFVTESLSLALAIDALDGACTPTTRLAHVQVPGDLTRVRAIAQGSPDGPLALLVVTTSVEDERTPGTERWSLFPPGARTAGWSAELPSGAALAADQRVRVTIDDTSHLQIRWPDGREGSARWDGTQILLSPPGIDLAAAGLGTAGGTAQAIEGAAADPNENATP